MSGAVVPIAGPRSSAHAEPTGAPTRTSKASMDAMRKAACNLAIFSPSGFMEANRQRMVVFQTLHKMSSNTFITFDAVSVAVRLKQHFVPFDPLPKKEMLQPISG